MKVLTEKHPLTKKLRKLEEFMSDNQILIELVGNRIEFIDSDSGHRATYVDDESNESGSEIPNFTMSKLIRTE